MTTVHVTILSCGSITIVTPETELARAWLAENVEPDALRWGPEGYVVEPRYLADLLDGLTRDLVSSEIVSGGVQ